MTNASLKFHYHPQKGWLNDPNGLSYFQGQYHLFYQHVPECEYPRKYPMCWGHAVTRDFLEFEELPEAICPDTEYDAGGVWSGTAVEHEGVLYCYYASVDGQGRQIISLATSRDGLHFEKYPGNPIIREYPPEGSRDFRDPAVLCCGDMNYLVIAAADTRRGTGNLLLYRSRNMTGWEYVGVLYEYADCKYCECPSIVKYGEGYILAVSVCKNDGTHYFEVLYGDFDGRSFKPQIVSHFQKGPDEYAGQVFSAPDGTPILISWIPGWKYQPKEKCIGCLSLPLKLSLSGGKLKAYPIPALAEKLDAEGGLTDSYIREEFVNGGEEVYIHLLETPK